MSTGLFEKDSYMTQANDERAARKQYIRRRQKAVFTIAGSRFDDRHW